MSLNPVTQTDGTTGRLAPQPFNGEYFVLRRDGLELEIRFPSTGQVFTSKGTLYLSSVRMVFTALSPTPEFTALDVPLAYLRSEKFNQPIFGCNNLSGSVFSVQAGGPSGEEPPWEFKFYFKEGGCGTFLALFYNILDLVRNADAQPPAPETEIPSAPPGTEEAVRTAYVDPNDPTTVYVAQPPSEGRIQPGQSYPTLTHRVGQALRSAAMFV